MRIGIPDHGIDAFIGDADGGPYQAATLLLAAIISVPGQAEVLLRGLLEIETDVQDDVESVLRALDDAAPLSTSLADLIRNIRSTATSVRGDIDVYRTWARHIARYSFATYHLFTGDTPSP